MAEEILVTRESIKLKRVDILEELADFKASGIQYPDNMKLVNVRGCNGSGKSTIPLQMLANDRGAYLLTLDGKEVATVFPNLNFVAMGTYRTKTGGLDRFKTNDDTKKVLELLWYLPYSILMEGIMASTIFSTYANLFHHYESRKPKREIIVFNLLPPWEVIRPRILRRNGGNDNIKWEGVESKYRTVKKNAKKFADEGFRSIIADNSNIKIEETLDWFFELIGGDK